MESERQTRFVASESENLWDGRESLFLSANSYFFLFNAEMPYTFLSSCGGGDQRRDAVIADYDSTALNLLITHDSCWRRQ